MFKIKAKKVNRKFLFNAIKAQQLTINKLQEAVFVLRQNAAEGAEEFTSILSALRPIEQERDVLRTVVQSLGLNRVSGVIALPDQSPGAAHLPSMSSAPR